MYNYTFETRHENFHGKFSLCAEYLIRLICRPLTTPALPSGRICNNIYDLSLVPEFN